MTFPGVAFLRTDFSQNSSFIRILMSDKIICRETEIAFKDAIQLTFQVDSRYLECLLILGKL